MTRYLFEILENDHADDDENRLLRLEEGGRAELGIITGTVANSTETILSLDEVNALADQFTHWLNRYRHQLADLGPYVNFRCQCCSAAISARLPGLAPREFACWNCGESIRIRVDFGTLSGSSGGG